MAQREGCGGGLNAVEGTAAQASEMEPAGGTGHAAGEACGARWRRPFPNLEEMAPLQGPAEAEAEPDA
jgi:hypothetical protein